MYNTVCNMELIGEYIHFGAAASIVIGAYGIIKFVESATGGAIKDWVKKLITYLVGLVVYFTFTATTDIDHGVLVTSYILSTGVYDFALKHIIDKLEIGYKD